MCHRERSIVKFRILAVACVLLPASVGAQFKYQVPPAPISQILDAGLLPMVTISPDRSWLLIEETAGLEPIARVAAPWIPLAGYRVNPRTNGPHSGYGTYIGTFKSLRLRSITGAIERMIDVPSDRIRDVTWSPDSRTVAFTVTSDDRIALWLADAATGRAREAAPLALNGATQTAPCAWLPDSRGLVCRVVPRDRGAPPAEPASPSGPVVQEADGTKAPVWTIQDLLQNPHDESLFDYYFTDQIALVGVDGQTTPVGSRGVHTQVAPSPDGQYLLVTTVQRPYSYRVGLAGFPNRVEVWDLRGQVVKQVADNPLQELSPIGGRAPTGPRSIGWMPGATATLVWAEALDGGDPGKKAEKRDRVYQLAAPFSDRPATIVDLDFRFAGITRARPDLAFITESWWATRWTRTWAIDPSKPGTPPRKLFDRSAQDRYGDPGRFVTVGDGRGARTVLLTPNGQAAYLTGDGASAEGDRPFLDRIDLATGKTERLWRSEAPYYESVEAVLDPMARQLVTQRESSTEPPNYFLRGPNGKPAVLLTRFVDPAPQFATIKPQLITYQREDGVQLSAKLFLPPGYTASQGPLPFLLWAYPQEFKDAKAASQVVGSPYRFSRPAALSDHLLLLTQGYGVLDGPTMPIIGEGEKQPNDSYVEQLVASAKAAIDKIVAMGVADRQRIAVGGHSYGGFMTANLLAHSDLFRAGLARSPAYNRTLTPFGFQSEPRTFWEARDVYMRMSPFTYADQLKEPMLMIHGEKDGNSGTFPVQSQRMFAALRATGGIARLVMLPAEDHLYLARESVGHALWEMNRWLDMYVKPPRSPTP
jgi:dipeptidyl aminopeptidase/acylaminoacyl peptidase